MTVARFFDDPRRHEFGVIVHHFPEGKYPVIRVDIHDQDTQGVMVVRLPLRVLVSTGNSGVERRAVFLSGHTHGGIEIGQ